MPKKVTFRTPFARVVAGLFLGAALLLSLSACDLAKNSLKVDRSADMEVQDYRDALAQRLPDISNKVAEDDGIPDLKPYMATPSDRLKPMPLVSIAVNQSVPLKDVLYELAEQAGYDMELDPRIKGSIIFSARNRPFDEVIQRLAKSAGLRYKFDQDTVKVELDTPYQQIYKINYLSFIRKNSSSISNNASVVTEGGTKAGSQFTADSTSEADFWGELTTNLTQIIGAGSDAGSLRTKKDPRITATADSAAPVEPVLLTADGDIAQTPQGGAAGSTGQGAPTQIKTPDAVLRVEPLPVDEEEQAAAGEENPFQPNFSINKQAGIISVFATEHLHKEIASYLDILRKSVTSQVLIEAKVLEVSLSDEFSAGIDWTAFTAKNLSFATDTVGDSLSPAFDPSSNPAISFGARYVGGDFSAAIEAMQRFGVVHALASPRLTVMNNQSAVLNVAKNQVYFDLKIEVSRDENGNNEGTTVESQIKTAPEGVLINVQPSIDLDNQTIAMSVRPTVSRIVDFVDNPGVTFVVANNGLDPDVLSAPVPVLNVQEFDSILQMNSGQSIVMGGLIQDRSTSTQNGVPVLGEVPLVGGLFRNQGDKIQKTELVVLLKATIVEGGNTVHQTDKDLYRSFSQDRRPFEL